MAVDEPQSFTQRWLLVPKLLYFTMNLAYYCCYTFRPKYLEETQGISTKSYGILAAVLSLALFFAGYFWSYLADRIGNTKAILIACTVSSAAVFQLFMIPFPDSYEMALATTVSALYIFFVGALIPLLDALVMNILVTVPGATKELYGRQRMWGTIAYSIISMAVGFYVKPLRPTVNYLVAILSAVFVLVTFFFLDNKPPQKKPATQSTAAGKDAEKGKEAKKVEVASNPQGKSGMYILLTNANFLFLLFVVFMNGWARATMTHFLEPIQRKVFKSPQWVTGVSTFTGVLFEIVVFFFSKPILNFFGVRRMLLVSQTAMIFRVGCYAFLPREFNGNHLMPIFYELFKGVGFGFMQTAAVTWVAEIAPPGTKATAQSLYTGVFAGLSAFVAGLVGFAIQGAAGANPTAQQEIALSVLLLQIVTYVSIAGLVLFFVKYIVIEEWMVKKTPASSADQKQQAK